MANQLLFLNFLSSNYCGPESSLALASSASLHPSFCSGSCPSKRRSILSALDKAGQSLPAPKARLGLSFDCPLCSPEKDAGVCRNGHLRHPPLTVIRVPPRIAPVSIWSGNAVSGKAQVVTRIAARWRESLLWR